MRVDVHQHLWTEPLVDALERRSRLPFVRCSDGLCTIHVAGEIAAAVDLASERPANRAALLARDGVDRALIAVRACWASRRSPRAEARGLIDATSTASRLSVIRSRRGVRSRSTACIPTTWTPCVNATAWACLCRPARSGREWICWRRCSRGSSDWSCRCSSTRVRARLATGRVSLSDPPWWPAMTRYVAQMQEAWLAFVTLVRRAHPRLRVVFAMLAGGAPLLSERLDARGGPALDLRERHAFFNTSSFGPAAIEAMARRVGGEQLLYGSDRPVVEPTPSGREALLSENAGWLAARTEVAA